jgi:uncharacterized membrane protein
MGNLIGNVQDRIKTSSNVLSLLAFKALTGLFLGLTLALIGQQIIGYGWISLVLVMFVVTGMLMRIARGWEWRHMLIFNLICVLIGAKESLYD